MEPNAPAAAGRRFGDKDLFQAHIKQKFVE
jgi:hypothetical protein